MAVSLEKFWDFFKSIFDIVDLFCNYLAGFLFHYSFSRLDRRFSQPEADGVWGGDGRRPA